MTTSIEFARASVALVVLHVLFEAEVERGVGVGGRHDVPARAAAADMVERGEAARDQIGLLEGRRGGGDQAEMFRSPPRAPAAASADRTK